MSIYLRFTAHLVSGEPCLLPALTDFVFVVVPRSNTPPIYAQTTPNALPTIHTRLHSTTSSSHHLILPHPSPTQGKSSRNSSRQRFALDRRPRPNWVCLPPREPLVPGYASNPWGRCQTTLPRDGKIGQASTIGTLPGALNLASCTAGLLPRNGWTRWKD